MSETNTMLLFHSLYRLNTDALDLMCRSSYSRSLPQKKEPVPGRVIWYAHKGPMRTRTGPKLSKAEKKAAKKERAALKTMNRRN